MIELEKVTRRYLGHRDGAVLDGLDLQVSAGEVVMISGASGSGKTTLLQLLYGAELPDGGAVRVFGHNVARLRRSSIAQLRRRIGVVPQDLQLLEERSALDNVAVALEVRALSRREVRVRAAEMLAMLGLAGAVDAPISELSFGERQRVAIARAVVSRPLLMLFDEPTAHLDPDGAEQLLGVIDELASGDAVAIVATTDRQVLSAGCLRGWTHYELAAGVLRLADAYAPTQTAESAEISEATAAPAAAAQPIDLAPTEEVTNVVPFPVARAGGTE